MRLSWKKIVVISIVFLVLIAGLLTWRWFHIDGSDLPLPDILPEDCTGVVAVKTWDNQQWEQDMTPEQIRQLLELLQDSVYWREPSDTVSGNWESTYWITLNYTEGGSHRYVFLQICGDTAMHIRGTDKDAFPRGFLRIRNDRWQEILHSIFPAP